VHLAGFTIDAMCFFFVFGFWKHNGDAWPTKNCWSQVFQRNALLGPRFWKIAVFVRITDMNTSTCLTPVSPCRCLYIYSSNGTIVWPQAFPLSRNKNTRTLKFVKQTVAMSVLLILTVPGFRNDMHHEKNAYRTQMFPLVLLSHYLPVWMPCVLWYCYCHLTWHVHTAECNWMRSLYYSVLSVTWS